MFEAMNHGLVGLPFDDHFVIFRVTKNALIRTTSYGPPVTAPAILTYYQTVRPFSWRF